MPTNVERLYGTLAEHLRAMHPDVLVMFTTDHYNEFFEASVPIFSIGVAESAPGPCDEVSEGHAFAAWRLE